MVLRQGSEQLPRGLRELGELGTSGNGSECAVEVEEERRFSARIVSVADASTMNRASCVPSARPNGMAMTVRRTSSPISTEATSPWVKPMTRRVARSRLRSDRAMRALLYTTPNATITAKVK